MLIMIFNDDDNPSNRERPPQRNKGSALPPGEPRYQKGRSTKFYLKRSQELRMLSSVTINCQITKIVMNSGSQLSEL